MPVAPLKMCGEILFGAYVLYREPSRLELGSEEGALDLVLVVYENPLLRQVRSRQEARLDRSQRDLEVEGSSFTETAFEPDGPTHHFDELLRNDEPQTGSTELFRGRGVDLAECLEQLGAVVLFDAYPTVLNLEA